jgi:hypothetical protein
MVGYKRIIAIACIILLAGCGNSAPGSPTENDGKPRDARTGKTFADKNELLEAVKAERPFEYQIVSEVTTENPKAMDSYLKYNSQTSDAFPQTRYLDFEGKETTREEFDAELAELKLSTDYGDVLTTYYQNIERNFFEESFKLIEPKASYSMIFGNRFEVFKSTQEQTKSVVRVTDVIPLEYRLVKQGEVCLVQITFRNTGFWVDSTLEGPPEDIQKEIAKTRPSKLPEAPVGKPDKIEKVILDWQFRTSGTIRMRLANVGGAWLIHDQI